MVIFLKVVKNSAKNLNFATWKKVFSIWGFSLESEFLTDDVEWILCCLGLLGWYRQGWLKLSTTEQLYDIHFSAKHFGESPFNVRHCMRKEKTFLNFISAGWPLNKENCIFMSRFTTHRGFCNKENISLRSISHPSITWKHNKIILSKAWTKFS